MRGEGVVILAAVALLGAVCAAYLAVVNRQMEKMLRDSQTRCRLLIQQMTDLVDENRRCNERIILKTTAVMILTMRIYAMHNDEEPYSMCRNRLHFWGVPFETLDDPDRLTEFFDKCLGDLMRVGDGIPPYSFKFTDSATRQEDGQDNRQQHKEDKK